MINDEIHIQLQNDIHELERTAGEYPHDSAIRYTFFGFVSVLKKSFEMTEGDKLQLVMARLKEVQPCTRGDLVDQLPFVREESRRLVTVGIDSGLIEVFIETTTGGRPAKMLRCP